VVKRFTPDRGDLIWIDMNPQAGHEQSGRRPAFVLSPAAYNSRTGLAVLCRVTSRRKGYPFEVELPDSGEVAGVVLADQVRNLDWRARKATSGGTAPAGVVEEVLGKLGTLIG
jgi:mRNA interferase MazF